MLIAEECNSDSSIKLIANNSLVNVILKYLHVSILLHILQVGLLHHHHMISQLGRVIRHRQVSLPEIIVRVRRDPAIIIRERGQIILHFNVMILIILPSLWSGSFCDPFGLVRRFGDPTAKTVSVRVDGLSFSSPGRRAN